jgi:hypothetical protein
MALSKTYFEQIPVEIVKKVAKDFTESARVGNDANPQVPNGVEPSTEPWRALAEQVQSELDPEKVIDLVKELISKIDEGRSSRSELSGAGKEQR